MRARRRYRTLEVLDSALLLIRAETSDRWAGTVMAAPEHDWRERVRGPITSVNVPGTNHTDVMMLARPGADRRAIARRIDDLLASRAGKRLSG